ncbi:MAG: hypothetical protein QS748_13940 [Candidatus Endonucleobacter bathymodioli]|uniref:Uncharacterized protein n=1 Tax=Candidatus Endonucleibacter bathymodioli TaxID=539814 RepID=A0AA90SUG7_9GAMM|nr:hypothetical protein [Candidatus Endonucleobacter bathymodioli]
MSINKVVKYYTISVLLAGSFVTSEAYSMNLVDMFMKAMTLAASVATIDCSEPLQSAPDNPSPSSWQAFHEVIRCPNELVELSPRAMQLCGGEKFYHCVGAQEKNTTKYYDGCFNSSKLVLDLDAKRIVYEIWGDNAHSESKRNFSRQFPNFYKEELCSGEGQKFEDGDGSGSSEYGECVCDEVNGYKQMKNHENCSSYDFCFDDSCYRSSNRDRVDCSADNNCLNITGVIYEDDLKSFADGMVNSRRSAFFFLLGNVPIFVVIPSLYYAYKHSSKSDEQDSSKSDEQLETKLEMEMVTIADGKIGCKEKVKFTKDKDGTSEFDIEMIMANNVSGVLGNILTCCNKKGEDNVIKHVKSAEILAIIPNKQPISE